VVLFLDAAHFVHSAFLGFLWTFTRLFIPAASGRYRWNVLGALDAVSLKVHTFCNDTTITAESVVEFLKQLRKSYGDKLITIFLDNARYQRCKKVQEEAKNLNIQLEYLPSYSPNLNLIERYWKFVKKKCLYSRFFENADDFRQAISSCIDQSGTVHQKELKTLLTWNFQTFKNVRLLPV
jgi:transposase